MSFFSVEKLDNPSDVVHVLLSAHSSAVSLPVCQEFFDTTTGGARNFEILHIVALRNLN